MAYELLVLDVDGTLVNTKKEITERTKEACGNVRTGDQGCNCFWAVHRGHPPSGKSDWT